jgi:hypothetical protein
MEENKTRKSAVSIKPRPLYLVGGAPLQVVKCPTLHLIPHYPQKSLPVVRQQSNPTQWPLLESYRVDQRGNQPMNMHTRASQFSSSEKYYAITTKLSTS